MKNEQEKKLEFKPSPKPTLGVEVEIQLLDPKSYELTSAIEPLLANVPEDLKENIKHEVMQCYVEISTDVCSDITAVRKDLTEKFNWIEKLSKEAGIKTLLSGTHPFSDWVDQKVSPIERYQKLVKELQWTARRMVIFGLHVHVGVDNADKAISVNNEMVKFLPHLLALTANSPFWRGHRTGLLSTRSKIFESLPTAGLPIYLKDFNEYLWLIKNMIQTNSIQTFREIWWDVRPHPDFGTVEIRICDCPTSFEEIMAIAGLIQTMVVKFSDDFSEGKEMLLTHPSIIRQNKWRAARYGVDDHFINWKTYEAIPAKEAIHSLLELLEPTSKKLGTGKELKGIEKILERNNGATHQLKFHEKKKDFKKLIDNLMGRFNEPL